MCQSELSTKIKISRIQRFQSRSQISYSSLTSELMSLRLTSESYTHNSEILTESTLSTPPQERESSQRELDGSHSLMSPIALRPYLKWEEFKLSRDQRLKLLFLRRSQRSPLLTAIPSELPTSSGTPKTRSSLNYSRERDKFNTLELLRIKKLEEQRDSDMLNSRTTELPTRPWEIWREPSSEEEPYSYRSPSQEDQEDHREEMMMITMVDSSCEQDD